MKRTTPAIIAGVLAGSLTVAVGLLASDEPSATQGGAALRRTNEHRMTGAISDIDRAKGKVSIKVGDETVQLLFPPTELVGFDRGDPVTVAVQLAQSPRESSRSHEGTIIR
jgi:hypothetical protein